MKERGVKKIIVDLSDWFVGEWTDELTKSDIKVEHSCGELTITLDLEKRDERTREIIAAALGEFLCGEGETYADVTPEGVVILSEDFRLPGGEKPDDMLYITIPWQTYKDNNRKAWHGVHANSASALVGFFKRECTQLGVDPIELLQADDPNRMAQEVIDK